jgi:HK97 family phage portal protein
VGGFRPWTWAKTAAAKRLLSDPAVGACFGEAFWRELAPPTAAGVPVTPLRALQVSAVQACVRLLADSIAQIDRHVYERTADVRRRAEDHPVYRLLHDAPNAEQTDVDFFSLMQAWLELRGNAYAIIERNAGTIVNLWPVHPESVSVKRRATDRVIIYTVRGDDGTSREYLARDILHIKYSLSDDGITGLSPIGMAREGIGLSLAAQDYGARFFSNDARPGIAFEVEGKMPPQEKARFLEAWAAEYSRGGAHRPAVLDQKMQIKTYGVSQKDAQFLETRQFQALEIAQIYGVPPHMIAIVEKTSSWGSGIQEQSLGFVIYTLGARLRRWEAAVNRSLLGDERGRYYMEFLTDSLLRGDIKSRYEAYQIARQNGIFNADEIRRRENENPIPDGKGQIYWQPVNMAPAGFDPGKQQEPVKRVTPAAAMDFTGRLNGHGHDDQ